jgi:glycosyltransferase involved in cell wall biosynthesis
MPKVSVIIPTFNREKYVVKAIQSVLGQQFEDYEIIVVDDGSTDHTRNILKNYGNEIHYIYQQNSGVGAARNAGINHSQGEWLAFLDSDDEWKTDYLSKQIEKAQEISGLCMQTTNCLFIGLNGLTKSYFEINKTFSVFKGDDYLFVKNPFCFIVKHGPWPMPATIIRRKAIIRAGLFDPSLNISEDFDLMARVAMIGSFGMIKESLMNVYRREESMNNCLTERVKINPIWAREVDARIYKKLKGTNGLKYKERRALDKILSANRRAIGNILQKSGKTREARKYYQRAVFIHPSIASIGKYILSFLPIKT